MEVEKMTPIQEAYTLMLEQPENNIKLIIDLLHSMDPRMEKPKQISDKLPFKRTGLAKGKVHLPEDFDEHFDNLDKEISKMFYGDAI